MNKESMIGHNVLVTGIGGVVGQGILRNIRNEDSGIRIIGTNITSVSAGNHLCDLVYKVPFAYENGYIPAVQEICSTEAIGLIIPSTDYECHYLSANAKRFKAKIACSPPDVTEFCLDKFKNFVAFRKQNIPFAESFLPSSYQGQFEKWVVKPREGRGSRNIFFNPVLSDNNFDDSYVVQEYLEGPEITTAFYVTQAGNLHGSITLVRELDHGNTVICEVVTDFDAELKKLIEGMIHVFPFRGSCNVQSKVTAKGIVPFEINCRISGTNSIRSQFGFKDVHYVLQEYLLDQKPDVPQITKGSAIRMMMDIIYPSKTIKAITAKNDSFYLY